MRLRARKHPALAAMGFGALVAAAAALGARATVSSVRSPWYIALEKPSWQPPASAFGPVWTALYAALAASAWRVWRSDAPARGPALALWGAQLALNAAWSPLFFGMKRTDVALLDVALLLPMAGAYAWSAGKTDRAAGWMAAPYVAWTGFALALNASIVAKNS